MTRLTLTSTEHPCMAMVRNESFTSGLSWGQGSPLLTMGEWSPNGRQIAFTLNDDLFLANGNGSGSKGIAHLSGFPQNPRWSPDWKATPLRGRLNEFTLSTLAYNITRLHAMCAA